MRKHNSLRAKVLMSLDASRFLSDAEVATYGADGCVNIHASTQVRRGGINRAQEKISMPRVRPAAHKFFTTVLNSFDRTAVQYPGVPSPSSSPGPT